MREHYERLAEMADRLGYGKLSAYFRKRATEYPCTNN